MNIRKILKLILWIIFFALCIYLRFYVDFDDSKDKKRIVETILSLCIILLAFRIFMDVMVIWYKLDKRNKGGRLKDNIVVGLSNLFSIFSVIAVILGLLSILGLRPTQVFTTLSIVAASIAIVTKEFIYEMIVGLYYGFSSKIELDDYIKVGEQRGKIIDIGLQKITLSNDDDDIVYIPNIKFYNSEIINYTKRDLRRMSVDFQLEIHMVKDLELLEKQLAEVLLQYKDFVEENSHTLKIIDINKDHFDFKFQYNLKSVSREIQRQIRKSIFRSIAILTVQQGSIPNAAINRQ